MSSRASGKHAGPGGASNQPEVAEPPLAERARTLVYLGRVGSLSTLSRKQQGFPFGSVMPYGLEDHANPVLPHQHDGYAHPKCAGRPAFQPVSDPARYYRRSLGSVHGSRC